MTENEFWRKCTSCKKGIGFHEKYWICSISSCNRVRTGLFFCSVSCFDAHVPVMNHKDAGAFEKRSPTLAQYKAQAEHDSEKEASPRPLKPQGAPDTDEILTVVSKVKSYVRARSGMNTSDAVMDRLSRHIRKWADEAIRRAEQSGRQTVLDRDVN